MKEVIEAAAEFVKKYFANMYDGNDYQHAERVYRKTIHIAAKEKANNFVCALAALLHGVDSDADHVNGACPKVREFLETQHLDARIIDWVCAIISEVDFSANRKKRHLATKEAEVVADANMLDAIGAVGIARCFAYGGAHNLNMYDGNISNNNMIKSFYDRLLVIKDCMRTATGRELAATRHDFMDRYLQQFYYEWKV